MKEEQLKKKKKINRERNTIYNAIILYRFMDMREFRKNPAQLKQN